MSGRANGKSAMPRTNETGAVMRVFSLKLLSVLLVLLAGSMTAGAPKDTPPTKGYRELAQPFIQRNCMRCHGAKKALAGFRIDQLEVDFTVARAAEHWKEVIDR